MVPLNKLPSSIRIDHVKAKALYKLESKRDAFLKEAAEEWLSVMKMDKRELWNSAIPQALFDTLDAWDPTCAIAAAYAFLKFAEKRYPATMHEIEQLALKKYEE